MSVPSLPWNRASAARRAAGLREFHEKALRLIRDARLCGMADPVAVVVDLSTPMGQRVADALFTQAEIDSARERAAGGLEPGYSTGVWTAVERDSLDWLPPRRAGVEHAIEVSKNGMRTMELTA